jgi:Protein of unknwon function (DUF3008)
MPAKSKAQQRFFGMVRAAQKGELKDPPKAVADVAGSMTMKAVKDFAATVLDHLPEHVDKEAFFRGVGDVVLEKKAKFLFFSNQAPELTGEPLVDSAILGAGVGTGFAGLNAGLEWLGERNLPPRLRRKYLDLLMQDAKWTVPIMGAGFPVMAGVFGPA